MRRENIRSLSLVICTLTYLLVGAAIFDAIESGYEERERVMLQAEEDSVIKRYNMSREEFENISNLVIHSKPYKSGIRWQFAGSVFFATTIITTIGYGQNTPHTTEGKIACMIYALLGIPLCLVMYQSVGERLNDFITFVIKQIKIALHFKNTEVAQNHLIAVTFSIIFLLISGGAVVFSEYEEWTYIDSLYYIVVSVATVGFGDYVPLQRPGTLQNDIRYITFTLFFIFFGLTVVSSMINLLVDKFVAVNKELTRAGEDDDFVENENVKMEEETAIFDSDSWASSTLTDSSPNAIGYRCTGIEVHNHWVQFFFPKFIFGRKHRISTKLTKSQYTMPTPAPNRRILRRRRASV